MAKIPGIRGMFRLPASEGAVSGDVEEEIAFHLEERTKELTARGMDPAAAREAALREFGDVKEARAELEQIGRRRVRNVRRSSWWSDLRQDARYTGRALLRSPAFTLVAVVTLALGIGATTAIFTVVDGVLLRPLGVVAPEELVLFRDVSADAEHEAPVIGTVGAANFVDWESSARSFTSMSYFTQFPQNLTGDGEPQEVQVQLVSGDLFPTLGVQPLLGRGFRPEEGAVIPGEELQVGEVAVLGHEFWRSRYGGDPGIIGKTIRLNDTPVEVIGVMSPDVRVLDTKPELWRPLSIPRANRTTMGRFLGAVGRLAPGATVESAEQEMGRVMKRLEQEFPGQNTDRRVELSSWRTEVVGEVRPALLVLLGAVAMLLLIACTNVANLLLGRASARRQEIAIRLSLGATRSRLVRQLLTESVVLALIGGGLGLALASVGTTTLVRSLPETVQLPRLDLVTVDGRVLAFALVVTLVTGIVFGLIPALGASPDLQSTLRDSGRGSTAGRAPMRLRSGLVVAEVALALMLLVGAGLLLRSFQKLQAVDMGMRAENVLTFRLALGSELYEEADARRAFVGQLLEQLDAIPGVQAVGTTSHLPLGDGRIGDSARRTDRPAPAPGQEPGTDFRIIGGDYFAAQGIRVVVGRVFDERDRVGAANTLIINEALARQQFAGEDPVGKRLVFEWRGEPVEGEIVGVVEDVRANSVAEEPLPALYHPFGQWAHPAPHVVIRTTGDPLAITGAAREVVRRLDPNLPVSRVATMESILSKATARSRMSSYLLGAFAAIALLLAAIGLYGIISYGVTQRRGEIGVRVALGADRKRILRLIVGQGMSLTAVGLVVGLVGAFALARLLGSLLYGVTSTDLATYAVVPLLLAGVALLASYLPANRAARVDPATALRSG